MGKSLLLILIPVFCWSPLVAQEKTPWHGRVCAVSLTYDDALNVHLDNVVPLLDSLGLKATFYLSGFFPSFRERSWEWRKVAEQGHELGNHTLFHPCDGRLPGREWVKPDYDLSKYSLQRIVDEITMANVLLNSVDGKSVRTFAYPCGEMKIRDTSYVEMIKESVAGARSVVGKMENLGTIDLYDIGSYMINGQTGEELISLVKQAMERKALIVFLFHGVGGEHSLNVSLEAHRTLLRFLKQNEKSIWVAPLVEVASYLREMKPPRH